MFTPRSSKGGSWRSHQTISGHSNVIARGSVRPRGKRTKSSGTKKCVFEGHHGVLVPGDDGIGPWKVKTQEGREIAKEESEDVGSSGGEEDVAEAKFGALKKPTTTTMLQCCRVP